MDANDASALIWMRAVRAWFAQGIGKNSAMAFRADFKFKSAMNLILEFIGSHVFHLFEQFFDLVRVGVVEFFAGHFGNRWIGKHINANHVERVGLKRLSA